MRELSKLKLHIKNLKDNKVKEVTLGVDYLFNALFSDQFEEPTKKKPGTGKTHIVGDGGTFEED